MHLLRMSRQMFIIILLFIGLSAVNGYFYFSVLGAEKNDLSKLESDLQFEEQMVAALQKRLVEKEEVREIDTKELQLRLPSKPLLDQYILQLQQAETVSRGTMLNLGFGSGDLGNVTFYREGNNEDIDSVDENQEDEVQNETASVEETLPEGVRRISVTMSYRARSYESLLQFLSAMESFDRITKIESISFGGYQGEDLSVSLSLSTFYGEGLDELIADLPKVDHVGPSNKTNPLPRNTNTTPSAPEATDSDDGENAEESDSDE